MSRFSKFMMRFCHYMTMKSGWQSRFWSEQYLEWAKRYYFRKEQ